MEKASAMRRLSFLGEGRASPLEPESSESGAPFEGLFLPGLTAERGQVTMASTRATLFLGTVRPGQRCDSKRIHDHRYHF
jgi:hypothetical protein